MSDQTYYKGAIVLPLAVAAVGLLIVPFDHHLPALLATISGSLRIFAIYGGVPYLLFAVPTLVLMRHAPAAALRSLTAVAPLILLILFWVFAAIYDVLTGPTFHQWPASAAFFGAFVLGIGYADAGLVELGHRLRRRKLRTAKPPSSIQM